MALPKIPFAQTIELFTHVLSGITINIIPNKDLKYRVKYRTPGNPKNYGVIGINQKLENHGGEL